MKSLFTAVFAILILSQMAFGQGRGERSEMDGERKLSRVIDGQQVGISTEAVNRDFSSIEGNVLKTGTTAYGFMTYDPLGQLISGPSKFGLGSPDEIQNIASASLWGMVLGGCMANEKWYAMEDDGGISYLWEIDIETGVMTEKTSTFPTVNALTYNQSNDTMYYISSDGAFQSIDLKTFQLNYISTISTTAKGLACNMYGELYAVDITDDVLLKIDTKGNFEIVGELGVDLNYSQDLEFDKNNDVLYLSGYEEGKGSGLYTIDVVSGKASLISPFQNGAIITSLAIPYQYDAIMPDKAEQLVVQSDENGELIASVSWVNPSVNIQGGNLESIAQVLVYRNDELVATITDGEPGGTNTIEDLDVPERGLYTYRVVSQDQYGNGMASMVEVFIGEDVPAAPMNVTLASEEGKGKLTWDAPVTGLHNNYFDGENLSYTIERSDGVVVIENMAGTTEYIDDVIMVTDQYRYNILVSNDLGLGGNANSNTAVLGSDDVIFVENFITGFVPDGWSVEGPLAQSWVLSESAQAGGTAPEANFEWGLVTTG